MKILLSFIFTVWVFSSDLKIENKYLEHILFQNNTQLLIDNQDNAKLSARELIVQKDQKNSKLLLNIAKSHIILEEYNKAIFYLIVFKGLFIDDNLYYEAKELYAKAINIQNLNQSYIRLYKSNFNVLELTIKKLLYFNTSEFKNELDFLIKLYKKNNIKSPLWLKQYKYLRFIEAYEYFKILNLNLNKSDEVKGINLFKHIPNNIKYELITKEIVKLNKIGSYNKAKELHTKYQDYLSFWQNNLIFYSLFY